MHSFVFDKEYEFGSHTKFVAEYLVGLLLISVEIETDEFVIKSFV